MALGGINALHFSGVMVGGPRRIGEGLVGFTLEQATQASGIPQALRVPCLAYGKRGERVQERGVDGSRLVLQGQIIERDGALTVFAHWIEFIEGTREARRTDGGEGGSGE